MKRNRAPPTPITKKICSSNLQKPGDSSDKYGDTKQSSNSKGATSLENKERLCVFCRVRPMKNASDQSFISVKPPDTVKVCSPDAQRDGIYKETHFIFNHVFDHNASQSEVFMKTSFDLVKNLLNGTNGLLFTYGITGSGKTYTMNGVTHNNGILPRCINLIFNSIQGSQAKKFVFKSDKMNGFEVQSEPEALLERQRELMANITTPVKHHKKESDDLISKQSSMFSPSSLSLKINEVNSGLYSIFITYVEIYNNAVYDLIEETSDDSLRVRPPQPKLVREDGAHNMYVHGVKEVEVKSADEAFEVYFKGQKRRRLAETALNTESSRSHSVFTLRCVKGLSHMQGDMFVKDRNALKVSQLSLVDLAGSERTSKTKTVGQRLREAGCINNSLLTLRTCLEILRENQTHNTNKMVPYRESKLTHLFKKYFDAEGDIRMIVCINPRNEDYEETLHVLKFSEMSQEIIINRAPPEPIRVPRPELIPPVTPIYKTPSRKLGHHVEPFQIKSESDVRSVPFGIGFSCEEYLELFEPNFPDFSLGAPDGDEFIALLKGKLEKSDQCNDIMEKMVDQLSSYYEEVETKYTTINDETKRLTNLLCSEQMKNSDLEKRIIKANTKISDLQMRMQSNHNTIKSLQSEVTEKDGQLKGQTEILRERNRYKNRLAQSKEKLYEMETKLQNQKSVFENEIMERDRKMLKVKRVLNTPTNCPSLAHGASVQVQPSSTPIMKARINSYDTPSVSRPTVAPRPAPFSVPAKKYAAVEKLDMVTPNVTRRAYRPQPRVPLSTPRRRSRSVSDGKEFWLDHCPPSGVAEVPETTVMHPVMKRRKSVTELTDVKDVVNSKTSKYCLTTRALDSDGDLETCLYKGDVIHTPGGGAQVKLNGVEILRQKSPPQSPKRRVPVSGEVVAKDLIMDRCGYAIEGHATPKH